MKQYYFYLTQNKKEKFIKKSEQLSSLSERNKKQLIGDANLISLEVLTVDPKFLGTTPVS